MTEEKFIITKEQVDKIWDLLNNHRTLKAKGVLKDLEEFQEDLLRDEIRKYLMNQGKSDISKKDIWDILDKTKIKLKEVKMAEDETTQEEETTETEAEKSEEDSKAEETSEETSEEKKEEAKEEKSE